MNGGVDQNRVRRQQGEGSSEAVGWAVDAVVSDGIETVAELCSALGRLDYNFVNYPLCGILRCAWQPKKGEAPPPINLPDVQLLPSVWEIYFTGRVSDWIDCDSDQEWLAGLSSVEIEKELSYAMYMPIRVISIELKHRNSPKLAVILRKWLWTVNITFSIWMILPSDCGTFIENTMDDDRDLWSVWADFRSLCANYAMHKFSVGLKIGADLPDEFLDLKSLRKWRSEPLATIWLDSSVFIFGKDQFFYVLPACHQNVFNELFNSLVQRPVIYTSSKNCITDSTKSACVKAIKSIINERIVHSQYDNTVANDYILMEFLNHREYVDTLQVPLQPLYDNLDATTYSIFEEDSTKYKKYCEAILLALNDLTRTVNGSRDIVVFVLGAGRGPLVQAVLDAESLYNSRRQVMMNQDMPEELCLKICAIEKNSGAVVNMNYRNSVQWNSRINIIESDMRKLVELRDSDLIPEPDLVISELLGSFGDNELSPECLDGLTDILRGTTISIPTYYQSYVAPIQSIRIHQKILTGFANKYFDKGHWGRCRSVAVPLSDGTYEIPRDDTCIFDEIFVIYLRSVYPLADPKPLFSFKHPNFDKKPNTRLASIEFEISSQSELMGFAGYFEAQLYGDCWISTVPDRKTKSLFSWFPAYIPLRQIVRLKSDAKVVLHMSRNADGGGVWYEWSTETTMQNAEVIRTDLQNKNGISCYMRL